MRKLGKLPEDFCTHGVFAKRSRGLRHKGLRDMEEVIRVHTKTTLHVCRVRANEAFKRPVSRSWKTFRYKLEDLGCRILAGTIPRLSRQGCIGLGQLLGAIVYTLDAHGRSVALANLEAVFGERFTSLERKEIARRSYQNFAPPMLDLFWSQGVGLHNFTQFTGVSGFMEILARAKREARGIVFVCAHQGNWEWAALAFANVGGRANIVAQDFKNRTLTQLFAKLRTHGQHTVIPQDKAMLRLLKCVLRGENTAILADLSLLPHQIPVALETFGPNPLEICATRLHIVLAQRGNALLVPVLTEPLANGKIRVRAEPPIETTPEMCPRKIAQETWAVFENCIRAKPELWLWSYKHFRFRPADATRAYPFYASVSEGFDSIRKEAKE